MGIQLFNWFTKITGFIPALLAFRTKIHYVDKQTQGRFIKGPAILISNHRKIFDYAVYLFVFFTRTLRVQAAEVLYTRPFMKPLLCSLGAIYVDRNHKDFGFVKKSLQLLKKGWIVHIYPEARLPKKDEETPLPFVPSAAYIALESGVPVIPVVTNGSYFNFRKRAHVLIGTPVYAADLMEDGLTDRENIDRVNEKLRDIIRGLQEKLNEMVL